MIKIRLKFLDAVKKYRTIYFPTVKITTCLSSFNETIDRFRNDIEDRNKKVCCYRSQKEEGTGERCPL